MCEVVRQTAQLLPAGRSPPSSCALPLPWTWPPTCTASLGRTVVGKWPWTAQMLECLCFVVLCDEGDVQTSESRPLRFAGMRPPRTGTLGVGVSLSPTKLSTRTIRPAVQSSPFPPCPIGWPPDGSSVPGPCPQHVTKPRRGHWAASFGPLASHSEKGLGFYS